MRTKKPKFRILSPDGFDINPEKMTYNSLIQVMRALILFKQRYAIQGYYSSSFYGKIELRHIPYECRVVKL